MHFQHIANGDETSRDIAKKYYGTSIQALNIAIVNGVEMDEVFAKGQKVAVRHIQNPQKPYLVLYDVSDLTQEITDFPAQGPTTKDPFEEGN